MLNDKWRFHQYCSKHGARVPTTIRLDNKAEIDFDDVCARVGLPFVLKPTNKSNCVGFRIVHSKRQFSKAIISDRKYNFSPLIAQAFVPGVDMDVSVLANRGHVENFAVQTINEDMVCFVQNEQLVKFAEAIVADLCYTGVIHIDARVHEVSKEVFLIESNPRFWASLAEATACGLNFVRAGICSVLGSQWSDPTTIYDVSAPSVRKMLAEIITGRQKYLELSRQQRYRVNCTARTLIHALWHLPLLNWPM
jgi:carbamoylphosphate synthase large subunit